LERQDYDETIFIANSNQLFIFKRGYDIPYFTADQAKPIPPKSKAIKAIKAIKVIKVIMVVACCCVLFCTPATSPQN
jgi:hypothetical protein